MDPAFRVPDHPDAVALRERYRLMEIAGEGDDFTRARRLKNWVRARWDHGWDNEGQPDAVSILARAQVGGRFHCGFYSRTLVECCLAVGLVAREMGVSTKHVEYPSPRWLPNHSHAVSEVYCRELAKWVMLDADANAFYEVSGEPVGCLEVHRALHEGRERSVRQVLDEPRFVVPDACPGLSPEANRRMWDDFRHARTVPFYHRVRALLCNGQSEPEVGERQRWVWYAGAVPPPVALAGTPLDARLHTAVVRDDDFNWPLQRTFIQSAVAVDSTAARLSVRLGHTMPFFDRFDITGADGSRGVVQGDEAIIDLPRGVSTVRAWCVDRLGRAGHAAELVISTEAGGAQ